MKIPGSWRLQRGLRQVRRRVVAHGMVLVYHRVADVSPDPWGLSVSPANFCEHLAVIRKYGDPLPFAEFPGILTRRRFARIPVSITFDDGYADNFYSAKPILARYDIPATVFVTTSMLDDRAGFWWDQLSYILLEMNSLPETLQLEIEDSAYSWHLGKTDSGTCGAESRTANWRAWEAPSTARQIAFRELWQILASLRDDQRQQAMNDLYRWAAVDEPSFSGGRTLASSELVELTRDGLVEVGAHAVTHSSLARLSLSEQRAEIVESKQQLEALVDYPVTSFAYPFGQKHDYTAETIALLRETGYTKGCTVRRALVDSKTDPLEIPRIHVDNCDGDVFAKAFVNWFSI